MKFLAPKEEIIPTPVTISRSDGQRFKENVTFFVICLVGIYVLIRLLIELKGILEPFLWAMFLVVTLKPAVDYCEARLLQSSMCNLVRIEQDDVVDECGDAGRMGMAFGDTEEMRSLIHNDDEDDEEEEEVMSKTEKVKARRQHLDENSLKITVARSIAVLLVVMLMLLVICGFLFTILESAKHMRTNWDVYQVGTQRFTKQVFVAFEQVFQHVPSSVKTKYDEVSSVSC